MKPEEIDQQEVTETPAEETETKAPETEETTTSEETVDKDALIAELEDKNRKLYARLKREEKRSDGETTEKPKAKKEEKPEALSRDEAKLYARGLEDEEVEKIKKIAFIEEITLDEAYKSDLFTTWKRNKEKEIELQKAALGASKGSKAVVKKSIDAPGLSDEEHKKLWTEKYR